MIYDTPGQKPGASLSTHAISTVAGVLYLTFLLSNLCYSQYISPTHEKYCKTVNHVSCQHDGEEVCGVGVVVSAST